MKRSTKIVLSVCAVFLTLMTAATMTLSIVTLTRVNAAGSISARPAEETEDAAYQDNDVTIAESYTILSTKAISDAYISGDSSSLSNDDKETLELASAVLEEVVDDGMSDYEKETAVFTWVHDNIRIDDSGLTLIQASPENVSTPRGVLKYKKAVCVGYATTFRLLMQMLDIPCLVLHDTSQVHSWDLVQIGGGWYHVDLYSAESLKDARSCLNLTDAMMTLDWDRTQYPAAESYEYCYLYRNASPIDDVYAVPAQLKAALDENRSYLSLLLKPYSEADKETADFMMSTLSYRITSSVEYCDYYFEYTVSDAGDGLLIAMTFYHTEDTDDGMTAPENVDEVKIDNAITEAFGELTEVYYDDEYYDYAG